MARKRKTQKPSRSVPGADYFSAQELAARQSRDSSQRSANQNQPGRPAGSRLDKLPVELLYEIDDHLDDAGALAFRVTCGRIREALLSRKRRTKELSNSYDREHLRWRLVWEAEWAEEEGREHPGEMQKTIHEVITKGDYIVCPHLRGAYFSKDKLKTFYSEVTGGHNVQESSVEFICENELCGAKCEVSLVFDTNFDWRPSRSCGVWNPEPDYCLYIVVSRRLELADMGGPEWLAKTEVMEGDESYANGHGRG
ncbi:hypothetical protein JOL62DRAFT_611226 [Phyllosticta paracitricarpa]|uniref:F-box domain-containing protein n=1 Tax=Phyllosticta paracitricarpa TaxID=2016321 RepID=A0ABR1N9E2_9PEZI